MLNPAMLLKIKSAKDKFTANHPKFPLFLNAVFNNAMEEGTVIEFTVTKSDGTKMESNIKLKESDIELMEQMKEMMK